MTVEEKQEVVRRSELVCEVIDKLVGSVEAVGETNTDGRHLNNLKVLENVLRHIIVTIGEETPNEMCIRDRLRMLKVLKLPYTNWKSGWWQKSTALI